MRLTLYLEHGSPVVDLRYSEIIEESMEIEFSLRFANSKNGNVETTQLDSGLPADPFTSFRINCEKGKCDGI